MIEDTTELEDAKWQPSRMSKRICLGKSALVDTYPGSWRCLEVVQIMRMWSDVPFFTARKHAKQRGVL